MTRPDYNATLPAFTPEEEHVAKVMLASQVASMMGRKMEEEDWTSVYRRAKGIPEAPWSNLNIDIMHQGLGVEHKLLRCSNLGQRPIKTVCGTTLMHPAATRSIRIADVNESPSRVMGEVLDQYNTLVDQRRAAVREKAPDMVPDMRLGWLLWEHSLTEFLYFEQQLGKIHPSDYYANWNETPPRGVRKGSKSLWIYDRYTHQKRYSVTTTAGIKIQPYFDVPSPNDPNLYYFRVQSEPIDYETVRLWVSARTARGLRQVLGQLTRGIVSRAIITVGSTPGIELDSGESGLEAAVAIPVTKDAYDILCATWSGVSDEHRVQLFLESLRTQGDGGRH